MNDNGGSLGAPCASRSQSAATRIGHPQAGFSFLKVWLLLLVLSLSISVAASVAPQIYEWYFLTDMADRIAYEYSELGINTVRARVRDELHRADLPHLDENLEILPTREGYRVTVNYLLVTSIWIAGMELSWPKYKEIDLYYQADS
ncbi:MAG: hypothetical protein HQL53_09370 [Magnetococcales bacterium]|nr:hypothetical protein [Magnetococcales bacterium]